MHQEVRNRDRVLAAIATEPLTVEEIEERTGLDRWVIVACIWLEVSKLQPVRQEGDPLTLRWRVA